MKVIVNSNEVEFNEEVTIQEMLEKVGLVYSRVVVEVNGVIIDRKKYDEYELKSDDNVDVIVFVAGG